MTTLLNYNSGEKWDFAFNRHLLFQLNLFLKIILKFSLNHKVNNIYQAEYFLEYLIFFKKSGG